MSELSETIVRLRKKADETQNDLAEVLGVSNRTVSKWETGETEPDCASLVSLAKHYGVTVDHLLGCEEKPGPYAGLGSADASRAFFHNLYETFSGVVDYFLGGNIAYPDPDAGKQVVPDLMYRQEWGNARVSGITSEPLIAHFISAPDSNLFLALMQNEENYRWLDTEADKLAQFFSVLSRPEAIRLIRLIHTHGFPAAFTADFAAEKLGCDVETVSAVLDRIAADCRLEVELEEGQKVIYQYWDGDGYLLALLSVAHEMLLENVTTTRGFNSTCKPIFGMKDSPKDSSKDGTKDSRNDSSKDSQNDGTKSERKEGAE